MIGESIGYRRSALSSQAMGSNYVGIHRPRSLNSYTPNDDLNPYCRGPRTEVSRFPHGLYILPLPAQRQAPGSR